MTHPNLFDPPAPTAPARAAWTQLYLSRLGKLYRYRIHTDRLQERHLAGDAVPNANRFELQYLAADETWHEVRFYGRREEIWGMVRDTIQEDPE